MSDAALEALAVAAGIAVEWRDYRGQAHRVDADTQRLLLRSAGLPADAPAQVAESTRQLQHLAQQPAALLVCDVGAALAVDGLDVDAGYQLVDENGARQDGRSWSEGGRTRVRAPTEPGYYQLQVANGAGGSGRQMQLAVAPPHCTAVPRTQRGRPWGIAAQLYALSEPGDMGLASYSTLSRFAAHAARHGAQALAVSPTHAMFSADPARCSPYAPSSRLFLNALHVDPVAAFGEAAVQQALERLGSSGAARHLELPHPPDQPLVDWSTAGSLRLALLRELHRSVLHEDRNAAADFAAFCRAGGEALQSHARFETLHALLGGSGWRDWPQALRDPQSDAVHRLVAQHGEETAFHAFAQWQAQVQLRAAHQQCRDSGMSIGLLADLAIGADPSGSHAWSRQSELLAGVSIGAPPDLLAAQGQAWGLAAFSPLALRASGYAAFLELLRATMACAGGLRIDHVMGLQRLWLVPEGGSSGNGAYLSYPAHDLLRLVALESMRHRCVVVGEDLGTVDPGLRTELSARRLLGMSVLYFEREGDRFVPPAHWRTDSVAMTSTHDLPTLAGWWDGHDLELRASVGQADASTLPDARAERARERTALWQAIQSSAGQDPAASAAPVPAREQFVQAAIAHVGRSAAALALVPLEDVLATPDAPNLPGTTSEHPNWRRRLPSPTAAELDRAGPAQRLAALDSARSAAQ